MQDASTPAGASLSTRQKHFFARAYVYNEIHKTSEQMHTHLLHAHMADLHVHIDITYVYLYTYVCTHMQQLMCIHVGVIHVCVITRICV